MSTEKTRYWQAKAAYHQNRRQRFDKKTRRLPLDARPTHLSTYQAISKHRAREERALKAAEATGE